MPPIQSSQNDPSNFNRNSSGYRSKGARAFRAESRRKGYGKASNMSFFIALFVFIAIVAFVIYFTRIL